MIFKGHTKRLIIKPNALFALHELEKKSGSNESGGILLGKIYPKHVFIEDITRPNIMDRFGKYFFIRSKKMAQKEINKSWKKSNGMLNYLGEWHSHPEINPIPSNVDRRMIHNALKNTIMEIDFLFVVIVGQKRTIWAGMQTKNGLEELELIS